MTIFGRNDRRAPDLKGLYLEYGRELWARLYAFCCDRDLAMDAVQEAFLRLQQHNGAAIDDAKRWLFRVGRNWLVDCKRTATRTSTDRDFDFNGLASGLPTPEQAIVRRELHESVRDALLELSAEDRETVVLRYALGWDSERMGEVLGVNSAAVDMRLSRARRRLAQVLCRQGVSNETI